MVNEKSKANSLPLCVVEVEPRAKLNRVHAVVYTCAIFALFYHHILHIFNSTTLLSSSPYVLLLLSDAIFAFMWLTSQAYRWHPVRSHAFPERLSRVMDDTEFPSLDVFICTADPFKEPPLCVVNTALSVMAYDYPSEKINVYVSDDGCSKLTLFAFIEATKFAMHWLPFCKNHGIGKRCPEAFFDSGGHGCPPKDSEKMKVLYEGMKERVNSVMEKGSIDDDMITSEERTAFDKWTAGFSYKDHPPVIQVLLESDKDVDVAGKAMPNLIYLSREKSSTFHHHFKAGALNVLVRVSAVMSNSPLVLNLDCDMYSNDPQAPRRALCYLLDPVIGGSKLAFVQFPQHFHGINKSDIYGSNMRRLYQIYPSGMDGHLGPCYVGSGTFFCRKAFYTSPSHPELCWHGNSSTDVTVDRKLIQSKPVLDAAYGAAKCSYEDGTEWGSKIGFRYGSLSEDYFTGYRLHCEGWRSVFCNPPIPAFLGDIPISLSDALSQVRRWSVGLLEVAFSKYCPVTYGIKRSSLLMGMSYANNAFWAIWSIPLLIYGFLPQLALLSNITLFPKVCDRWFYLYAYLFITSYIQDLAEDLIYGGTFERWWNDQRMWMIRGVSSFLFGLIQFSLKQMGISRVGFDVTSKVIGDDQQQRYDREVFDFGAETPMFIPLSTIAIINLASFTGGLVMVLKQGSLGEMFVQLFICGFVMVNCWPIYEAMVLRRDKGRMPTRITLVAVFLVWILCRLANFMSKS